MKKTKILQTRLYFLGILCFVDRFDPLKLIFGPNRTSRKPSSTDGRRDRVERTAKVGQKEAQRGPGEAQDRSQSHPGAAIEMEIVVLS